MCVHCIDVNKTKIMRPRPRSDQPDLG